MVNINHDNTAVNDDNDDDDSNNHFHNDNDITIIRETNQLCKSSRIIIFFKVAESFEKNQF